MVPFFFWGSTRGVVCPGIFSERDCGVCPIDLAHLIREDGWHTVNLKQCGGIRIHRGWALSARLRNFIRGAGSTGQTALLGQVLLSKPSHPESKSNHLAQTSCLSLKWRQTWSFSSQRAKLIIFWDCSLISWVQKQGFFFVLHISLYRPGYLLWPGL